MAYTYRIENENEIIVWIDKDGYQTLRQPHHPNAYMNAPWVSVEEAEAWAAAKVSELVNEELLASTQNDKLDQILKLLQG